MELLSQKLTISGYHTAKVKDAEKETNWRGKYHHIASVSKGAHYFRVWGKFKKRDQGKWKLNWLEDIKIGVCSIEICDKGNT